MTSIDAVTLEVADLAAADAFYSAAFDLGDRLALRASDAPTSGYRGFTMALGVSQPATVDALIGAAVDAEGGDAAEAAKEVGVGLRRRGASPNGTVWKASSSAKKNTGPATREIDAIVLLLGVADVAASSNLVELGLPVGRSFARKYVEFSTTGIELALLGRVRWPRTRVCPGRQRITSNRHRRRRRLLHRPGRIRWAGSRKPRDERHTANRSSQAS